jgi:hypothetical protein
MKYFTNKKYMGFFAVLAILTCFYFGYSIITNDTSQETVSHVQDVQPPVDRAVPAINTDGTQIIKPSVNTEVITNSDESEAVTQ